MNIFVLDLNINKCTQYHVNKHVVKMILESAQMLSNCHYYDDNTGPYKKIHYNHPCSIWVRSSKQNYKWLYCLFLSLLDEYTFRYEKIHKCSRLIDVLKICPDYISDLKLTPFAQAMPDKYKHRDIVTAYRQYYLGEKSFISMEM